MAFNVRTSSRQIKTDFPREIHQIDHVWIPMRDGTRLAASIWLPIDAEDNPVPAILEYIPYRKNDFTALRDSIRHPYFAGHGYASVRVDIRGSGDSDGILYDEYLPQELNDAVEVIAWISAQSWCTGSVGMIGKSWGGFNGLQVAALRPPELKAVISLCSTDDRYADDVHYLGGCVLASDMLGWASTMLAYNARPADKAVVGDRWHSDWLERLEKTPPFVETWLQHQRRDDFWKHGSVCGNYEDIDIPIFAVGGWADAYTNAILRMLEGLPGPRKGLIGPWVHEYPEVAVPEPAIGFLQECLRWWDYWLKGIDTGIMDEPMLRAWMQDSVSPQTYYAERPGRWVAETAWPSPNIVSKDYWLNDSQLVEAPAENMEIPVSSTQSHGLYAGVFCPFGQPGDFASDQRFENGMSVCFTSKPLVSPMEILGHPEVTVELKSDQPNALLAVRLCDVAPDGASTLVSWGMLNLTHRESHEHPTPLVPNERYTVTVRLNAVGHVLPTGHRWQLALAPTYWPQAWPSPKQVTLTVISGKETRLALPVRPPQALDEELPAFEQPETASLLKQEVMREGNRDREIRYDRVQGIWQLIDVTDGGFRRLLPNGVEYGSVNRNIYTIADDDPLSAQARCEWDIRVGRGEWQTRVETVSTMSADTEHFSVTNEVTAYEGESQIFKKNWTRKIPRDLV